MSSGSVEALKTDSLLFRIHPVERGALWFGPAPGEPPRHRFDSPDGDYGVCYLAMEPAGAFVESFLRLDVHRTDTRILAASELLNRRIVPVQLTSDLEVVSLRGPGLAWRGLTASVSSSPVYGDTQRISKAIHAESAELAGISYRSRHDNDQIAIALFDRARGALDVLNRRARSCLDLALALESDYPFAIDFDE